MIHAQWSAGLNIETVLLSRNQEHSICIVLNVFCVIIVIVRKLKKDGRERGGVVVTRQLPGNDAVGLICYSQKPQH